MDVYKLSGFRVRKVNQPSDIGEPRKIAIYSTTALGDFLLNTPAIMAIRRRFPSASITLVVNARNVQLVQGSDVFDDIVFWNGKLNGVLSLAKTLRAKALDATFILHSRAPYDIVTATLARSPLIFKDVYFNDYHGQDSFVLGRFLSYYYDHRTVADASLIKKKLNQMSLLGIHSRSPEMFIPVRYTPEKVRNVTLGVHLGASSGERCWPVEHFVQVIRRVLAGFPDVDVALLGGNGEAERNRLCLALLGDTDNRVRDFAGKTSLKQLTEKISSLSCLLVGDTGPMHIAIAVRTPVVALFPSHLAAEGTRPLQDTDLHQVIISRSETEDNIGLIGVDEVSEAVCGVLARQPAYADDQSLSPYVPPIKKEIFI